ncbi:dna ligase [Lentinula edodes]|uniref:DNA ligase n=1 Tax=Lentinula edodes TaxID=5353 RepID=A0A1Q3EAQ3_LENED|nr:dna ligase [Lentinula edodes]
MSTSKRRIDRPSTPVHSKRRKDTQSRLDSFFSSPSVSERPGKVKADSFQKSIAKDIEIIDVDLLDDDVVSAPEHQSSSSPKKNSSALRPVKLIQAGRKDAFANVQHTTPDYAPLAVDPSTYTTISMDIAQDTLSSRFRSAEHLLRKVFVQHPSYDHIVGALLEVGLDGLPQRVPLTVGIPVYPALGSPIRSFEEIYERLNDLPFSAELKYDGQRAQIHVLRQSDGPIDVRVFSRHLEDMTSKYPDVTGLMQVLLEIHPETQSLILDSEIVAIDRATGSLKSFQALSSRARKDVRLEKVEISVGVFVFDLLYLDGEILLDRSFRTRRSLMRNRFPSYIPENELLARFQHVDSCDSEESQIQLQNFWETAVSRHDTEGLMIKLLDHEVCDEDSKGKLQARKKPLSAIYDADKRTFSWMKLKKDYVSGIGDSLDLIPIGAWYGNGRKVKWWSPILLGIWDPDQGHPVAICKCMSGFTDAFYKTLSEQFSLDDASKCSRSRLWDCEFGGFKPDVYFKPDMVWEIRGADITLSPISIAACHLTSSSKGLSLRFPRFIRVRDDKTIMQASDASFLANLWKSQQGKSKEQDDELIDVDVDSTSDYSEMDDIDI